MLRTDSHILEEGCTGSGEVQTSVFKHISTAKPESRKTSELSEAIAKTFAQMHGDTLLGSASNEWQRVVEHCPDLGNGEYSKRLAEVVAIALVQFPLFWRHEYIFNFLP